MTTLGAAFLAAMESDDNPDNVAYIEDDLEPCVLIVTMDGRPVPIAVYEVEVSPVEVELPGEVCQPCPAMDLTFLLFALLVAVAAWLMM
jgi:hypothetical protein